MSSLFEIAPFPVDLPEGPRVLVRPLDQGDLARVRRAYVMLSPESRMNRFWEKPRELSPSRARSLTDTDRSDHVAWIAIPPGDASPGSALPGDASPGDASPGDASPGDASPGDASLPGYAGASFWRDSERPERAEIAFTVADDWQRKGFSTLLFSVLWFEAWQVGIREFFAFSRPANHAMIDWWESVGGTARPGTRQVELSLPLESPRSFVDRVGFEMPPSHRRVEVAEWITLWIEKVGD